MNAIIKMVQKNKFLALVILVYIALFVLQSDKAVLAFQNSLYYVREMLTIMPVILLLTALINTWVPQDAIRRNLGRDAGTKGAIFSFLLGSFSAGPIYAAFPVSKTLLRKGASISNIVILLSTWAVVKVPMLLNEAKFLGPKFMFARWVLTTVSIFIIGFITSKLVSEADLPLDEAREIMINDEICLDENYCIGCGICAQLAPTYFKIKNNKASVVKQIVAQTDTDTVNKAIEKCPANIIALK